MARIGTKDTAPEKIVRTALHRSGYRFRLHRRDLPGTPDIVFIAARKIIFVHGCFWHGHVCRHLPKTNSKFWKRKIEGNKVRDAKSVAKLRRMGWRVLTLWECEVNANRWETRALRFLNDDPNAVI